MTRAEALARARRTWGASFGAVRLSTWHDRLAGRRLRAYQVGEYVVEGRARRPFFLARGESPESWVAAFEDYERRRDGS